MPSFALYLIAIFCSPAYFLIRKKWVSFGFNLMWYIASFPLLFVFGVGVFTWLIGAMHAVWHIRAELVEHQATMIAKKMKEAGA